MEIPVFYPPEIISEITGKFRSCFGDIRQFRHFNEMITAMYTTERRSIAHLNSTIMDHVNQSNMNRCLSSHMDTGMMFMKTVNLINKVEKDGILAIDDTIVEKTGKNIECAGWIFDHSQGKSVWGIQMATSVLSGDYGIYPVSAIVYQRKEKLEKEQRVNEYRPKIEIQKETIEKCISADLHFSTLTGDAWYFTSGLIEFLKEKKKDWVFQVKGNRRIKIKGRWTTLDSISLSYEDAETLTISGNIYTVWSMEGRIRGAGSVKIIISEGITGRRYYATNRKDWKIKKTMETYLHRWDIEVMHRDLKQDGIGHIFLRKLGKIELYLRLMATGRVILEISGIRSLNRYPDIPERIEKRKRWIAFELLESLFKGFRKYGDHFMEALRQSIMNPYRSTRNILKPVGNIHSGNAI